MNIDNAMNRFFKSHVVYHFKQFFRRILGDGLTELAENQLLSMRSSIMKLSSNLKKSQNDSSASGKIAIDSTLEVGRELLLIDNKRNMLSRISETDSFNNDWPRRFTQTDKTQSSDNHATATSNQTYETPTTSLADYSIPEKNFIQGEIRRKLIRLKHLVNFRVPH